LNRKLEEVLGVGKEFQSVADLWGVSKTDTSKHTPMLIVPAVFTEIRQPDSGAQGESFERIACISV